jgi:hypothetical protein
MRVWRTKHGTYLIEKNLLPIPEVNEGIGLNNGERFYDASEYYEMNDAGDIIKKYDKPYPFSLEDDLSVSSIHRVIGDCLYDFYWCLHFATTILDHRLVLSGLEPAELPSNMALKL